MLLFAQQRSAAALLVTTRAALASKIVDVPAIRDRVRFQQHGIDPALFAPEPAERERALASARILFLANVGVRKGIFQLIEAFAGVHRVRPDARLVIGGEGPTLWAVRERIAALGLSDAVDVRGHVPRAEVAALLHGSAVYCLPSLGEPYGMTAIEAMAAGLPLVVTAGGGLGEVADARGAVFVRERDVDGLREALLSLLEHPEHARAMGDHNLERVRSEFAWPVVVDALEGTYASVRERAGRRR
jgi:glycosyltransferase involved in cell wall biosynthesis